MGDYIGIVRDLEGQAHRIASTVAGHCETMPDVAAKTVTISDVDELIDGMTIRVHFTYGNSAQSPTLDVNGGGAVPIWVTDAYAPSDADGSSWLPGSVVALTYSSSIRGSAWYVNDPSPGTRDYALLSGRPSIEGVTLEGNKTLPQLGIFVDADAEYPESDAYALDTADIDRLWAMAQPLG